MIVGVRLCRLMALLFMLFLTMVILTVGGGILRQGQRG